MLSPSGRLGHQALCIRIDQVVIILGVLAGFLVGTAGPVAGQAEIVPSEHPVYEYLHHQATAGRLPEYRHGVRPFSRGRIQTLLDSLTIRKAGDRAQAAEWLSHFRTEFAEPAGQRETALSEDGIQFPTEPRSLKYLYYEDSGPWRVAVRGMGHLTHRGARDSMEVGGTSIAARLRVEGHYEKWIGFYSDTFNGYQFRGETPVLKRDPVLEPLYYVSRSAQPFGNFDRTSASLRIGNQRVAAELAHERLALGPGYGESLILGSGADYFPFARVSLRTGTVGYQYIHGALGDRSRRVRAEGSTGSSGRLGIQRNLALHRIEFHPSPPLSLAFTEWVIYGLRGPELAYLNPVFPFTVAEHALWDRDNVLLALDGSYRPWAGVKLYGTFLVDDIDLSQIGEHSYHQKLGYQVGLGGSLHPLVQSWISYTRVDPYVYTHRFRLRGSFYNSYHHHGFPLGHPIGPNADQWELGTRIWWPHWIRTDLRLWYRRRGERYVGSDNEWIRVGGDIEDGRHPPFSERSKQFLAGGQFTGPGGSVDITWEPIRDLLQFHLRVQYQIWTYGGIRPLHGEDPPPDESLTRVRGSGSDRLFTRFGLRLGGGW